MSKQQQQKMKLLYLQKIFTENTDEEHGLTVKELIARLNEYGISAERKSIYDDIETLRMFGLDICSRRDKAVRYFLASRDFEMPELKLLVDAIQSSRFITYKKSCELISKIERLSSIHDGRLLQRQVCVLNRVKTMNEKIYYNIDSIHTAISENKKIRFKYYETVFDPESSRHFIQRPKRGGADYIASPQALTWENENYYLIAFDNIKSDTRHYRVDKMSSISLINEERTLSRETDNFDIAEYSKRIFSMFGGRKCDVTIRFENRLAGVAEDKFGPDVFVRKFGAEHFEINVRIEISSQFYGWLFGLGDGAQIVSPESEVNNFKNYLDLVKNSYITMK